MRRGSRFLILLHAVTETTWHICSLELQRSLVKVSAGIHVSSRGYMCSTSDSSKISVALSLWNFIMFEYVFTNTTSDHRMT